MQSKHEMIRAKVAEIMSARSGWSGPLGMFMEETGGDDGGSLLDEAANDGGNGDTGGDGDDDGDNGGSGVDEEALVAKVVAALEGKFDSIADRRVNAILKEVRKGKKDDDGGDDGESGAQSTRSAGPAAGDVREARLAYREYVTDGFRFLGDVEREHAMTMAQGMLPALLSGGLDPDEAGREAAKKVRSSVQALRKHYEGQTVAALKRKGLLAEDARPGQPPASSSGTRKPGAESGFKAGAAKAGELFPGRMPQTQN